MNLSTTPICDTEGFQVYTKEYGNVDVLPLDSARTLERLARELAASGDPKPWRIEQWKSAVSELKSMKSPACIHCGKSEDDHFRGFCHRNYSFIGSLSFTP